MWSIADADRAANDLAREYCRGLNPIVADDMWHVLTTHPSGLNSKTPTFRFYHVIPIARDLGLSDICQAAALQFATMAGTVAFIMIDDVIDHRKMDQQSAKQLLLANLLHFKYIQVLIRLPLPQIEFWDLVGTYCEDGFIGMFREEKEQVGVAAKGYDASSVDIIHDKTNPIRAIIVAIALLTENRHCIEKLMAMHVRNGVMLQLLDDLLDWEEDLAQDRRTYPLSLALAESGVCLDDHRTIDARERALILKALWYGETVFTVIAKIHGLFRETMEIGTGQFPIYEEAMRKYFAEFQTIWTEHVRFHNSITGELNRIPTLMKEMIDG